MKRLFLFALLFFSLFSICIAYNYVSVNYSFSYNIESVKEDEFWCVNIKKSQILKFLKKENISLASLSKIRQNKNESNETISLDVGGKIIEFEKIKNEFNLKSNKIESIKQSRNEIIITGKYN